jgi:sensor histidine kinase YesM
LQPGTDPTKLFGVTSDNADAATTGHYSTGVGLANIRDRLGQAYGENQRFDIANGADGGFSVVIELPFEAREPAPARAARLAPGSSTTLATAG